MNYVGVDLHKEQSWFYITDCLGNKLLSKSISNSPQTLKRFLARVNTGSPIFIFEARSFGFLNIPL